MTDRNRSNKHQGSDTPPQKGLRGNEQPPGNASSRGRPSSDDDDVFDLPDWSETPPRSSSRDSSVRSSSSRRSSVPDNEPRTSGRRESIPELGRAFRQADRRSRDDDPDEVASDPDRPKDRFRRIAKKPVQSFEFEDASLDYPEKPSDMLDQFPRIPRELSQRRLLGGARVRTIPTRAPGSGRSLRGQQIGGLIAASGPQSRFIAGVSGIALISLVLMVATVAGRVGSIPAWLPIHLNAQGIPDRWGTASTLWRLPLMVVFVSLMGGAVAWALRNRDAFAMRFALGSTILIHCLTWIALVNLAW